MKLARKLTLAIIAGILVITALAAVVRVRNEASHFLGDMSRDHRFVGHALRSAVESIWENYGEDRAALLVHTTRASPTTLRVVSLGPGAPPARQPSVRPELLEGLRSGQDMELISDGRFLTYIPLRVQPAGAFALEIGEGLEEQRLYVRFIIQNTLIAAFAIVLLGSVLAIALGYTFVGRPMMKLTEKARRIGTGDLSGPLVFKQHDEIAEFASEMNSMCDRLAAAQQKVEMEATARIEAIEQLRHADRLRTVGQLASGLAHELGTPLNVVLGRARMIAAGDATPEEAAESARAIADQAERMTTLIRQLLDFARRRGPDLQRLDLSEIARATAAMLGPLGDKRGVKIEFTPPPTPVEADLDATQIQQALTNLVMNAVQASESSRTPVSLEVGERVVHTPADLGNEERSFRYVSVRDRGAGIARENLTRIFEPFFTTKDVGDGTGLGLSVAYGIVRDHEGWIDVESEPGQGSTFTMYLPGRKGEGASATPRLSQSLFDGVPRAAVIRSGATESNEAGRPQTADGR